MRNNLIIQHNSSDDGMPRSLPFWLSLTNYYVLSTGISIATFFCVWGLLHGTEDELPWITAGIMASLVLIGAVLIREVFVRRCIRNYYGNVRQLDYGRNNVYNRTQRTGSDRLTLQRNSEVLRELDRKSLLAKSFGQVSGPHLELFEMCEAYLQKSTKELNGIQKTSPRFSVIQNGREHVNKLHKFHLFAWAAIETQLLVQTAKFQATISEKLEYANRAIGILDSAANFYPNDEKLFDSKMSVQDYIVEIKVAHWVEQAERSAFKGNYQRAISHYKDALYFLARENNQTAEMEVVASKINSEIEKIRSEYKKKRKRNE